METNSDPAATRLDAVIRLLAIQLTAGLNTVEAILLLDRAGLDRGVIAEVCQTTPNTVHARISEARRKRKAPSRKGRSVKGAKK
jgi:DNA-directed RNA polymerase specialized sigma24 family protein